MFTQKISMDCTQEQYEKYLKEELCKMGYIERGMDFEWLDDGIIVNNYMNTIKEIANVVKGNKDISDRTYLGSFNSDLFLALAAMTDMSYGGYGEWWMATNFSGYFTKGKLYKANKPINDCKAFYNDRGKLNDEYPFNLDYFRKATVDEIMNKFKTKEMDLEKYINSLTERDLTGDIIDFPLDIVKQMVREQVAQGNEPDVTIFQNSRSELKERGGFDWSRTIIGFSEWNNIIQNKDFNLFYKLFPKYKKETDKKIMKEYKYKRSEILKIRNVACVTWKERILDMILKSYDPIEDTVTLTEEQIQEMFDAAATSSQSTVLNDVFKDFSTRKNLMRNKVNMTDIENIFKEKVQLLVGATPIDKPELMQKALWVSSDVEIEIGEATGNKSGGKYIAFYLKE